MSGGLFVAALAREVGTDLDRDMLARLPSLHADAYVDKFDSVRRCRERSSCWPG